MKTLLLSTIAAAGLAISASAAFADGNGADFYDVQRAPGVSAAAPARAHQVVTRGGDRVFLTQERQPSVSGHAEDSAQFWGVVNSQRPAF